MKIGLRGDVVEEVVVKFKDLLMGDPGRPDAFEWVNRGREFGFLVLVTTSTRTVVVVVVGVMRGNTTTKRFRFDGCGVWVGELDQFIVGVELVIDVGEDKITTGQEESGAKGFGQEVGRDDGLFFDGASP